MQSMELHELQQEVEHLTGRRMHTPKDFQWLSDEIFSRLHRTLSPSTLKRLWGYIDGADKTRNSTLEILSRFLGFANWDEFVESISQEGNSNAVLSPHIEAKELKKGDLVKVSWRPNRRCTFRYLGKEQFVVETAENSKLKVGDTFYCSLFILGEPLYLSRLVQGNNPPVDFVVGNKGGLCELERE
jgi:hypothetical protein